MTLPSWMYGDPAKVVERLEAIDEAQKKRRTLHLVERPAPAARKCDGCAYKARLWGVSFCEKGMTGNGEENMRRCSLYTVLRTAANPPGGTKA